MSKGKIKGKVNVKSKSKDKGYSTVKEEYPYPSQFGSHGVMVDAAETERLGHPGMVVCKDDYGLYVTDKGRLDDGVADYNRFSSPEWREARLLEVAGEVFDVVIP